MNQSEKTNENCPPPSRTTLEQWRVLDAVVTFGSYAAAAEALNRSHSSLHQAVQKLQHQLDVQLLEVRGRRAELTAQGEILLRRARLLTNDARSLERLAESLAAGWEGELTVSMEQVYPRSAMICALAEFHPLSRGTRVRLVEDVISGSEEAIAREGADLVITAHVPPERFCRPLGRVRFVPVAHPAHALFTVQQPISQRDLHRELHIVIADTGRGRKRESTWLSPAQRWTVDHFAAALDILRSGFGFSFLPEHLVSSDLAEGRLRELCIADFSPLSVEFRLVLPRGERSGPAARTLAECVLRHAPEVSS